jgi:hypothetical protein
MGPLLLLVCAVGARPIADELIHLDAGHTAQSDMVVKIHVCPLLQLGVQVAEHPEGLQVPLTNLSR